MKNFRKKSVEIINEVMNSVEIINEVKNSVEIINEVKNRMKENYTKQGGRGGQRVKEEYAIKSKKGGGNGKKYENKEYHREAEFEKQKRKTGK